MDKKYQNVEKVSLQDEMPVVEDNTEKPHHLSSIKKVIAVVSGKGGVGKSLITSLSAVEMQRRGYKTAVLDADITGPSIPQYFGVKGKATSNSFGVVPLRSAAGTDVMSINLLLDDITQPVVWRGPIVSNTVKQFWTEVIWEDIDYMFIDMPPGTGDVALTIFQSLPIDGIIVVTSPQELVSMIVTKAVNMAKKMSVPIIGIVENMSYFICDACDKKHEIYGPSLVNKVSNDFGLPILAKVPIEPTMASLCDAGKIQDYQATWLSDYGRILEDLNG